MTPVQQQQQRQQLAAKVTRCQCPRTPVSPYCKWGWDLWRGFQRELPDAWHLWPGNGNGDGTKKKDEHHFLGTS